MFWQPEKQAGFLLAALLAQDRDLSAVSQALLPQAHEGLQATLGDSQLSSPEAKSQTIASWVRVLRPEPDRSALALPSRMQSILARGARAPLKSQLLADGQPTRPDFWLEPQLASVISRIARHAARTRQA